MNRLPKLDLSLDPDQYDPAAVKLAPSDYIRVRGLDLPVGTPGIMAKARFKTLVTSFSGQVSAISISTFQELFAFHRARPAGFALMHSPAAHMSSS